MVYKYTGSYNVTTTQFTYRMHACTSQNIIINLYIKVHIHSYAFIYNVTNQMHIASCMCIQLAIASSVIQILRSGCLQSFCMLVNIQLPKMSLGVKMNQYKYICMHAQICTNSSSHLHLCSQLHVNGLSYIDSYSYRFESMLAIIYVANFSQAIVEMIQKLTLEILKYHSIDEYCIRVQ